MTLLDPGTWQESQPASPPVSTEPGKQAGDLAGGRNRH